MKMKFFAIAAIGVLALAACSQSGNNSATNDAAEQADVSQQADVVETFTGVLPQADGSGVDYTLTLNYNQGKDSADGVYTLTQVYDGSQKETFKSNGTFVVGQKGDQTYLKLVNDSDSTDTAYYLVEGPNTITMVSETLEKSPTGLNYTLTKQ